MDLLSALRIHLALDEKPVLALDPVEDMSRSEMISKAADLRTQRDVIKQKIKESGGGAGASELRNQLEALESKIKNLEKMQSQAKDDDIEQTEDADIKFATYGEWSDAVAKKIPKAKIDGNFAYLGTKVVAEYRGKNRFSFISDKTAQDEAVAFDYASVREYDADGRLHVATTHISKANVCPYYGREIPFATQLGLAPDTIYKMYRHPDELKKAADSFNNLPLLSKHVAVSADQHPSDLVIGSTGTDAVFNFPYLDNSLVVWTRSGIAAIEEEVQKELSCAYRYTADMTPGTIDGEAYDGVMREIVGNHVALVKAGRAGPDVVVGDNALPKLKELFMSSATVLSPKAAVAKGALIVFLRPLLAADTQIDLNPILLGVTQANFSDKKDGIFSALTAQLQGKLAKDAKLDGVSELLNALDEFKEEEEEEVKSKKGVAGKDKKAKDAEEDEDDDEEKKKKKAADALKAAADAEEEEDDKKKKAAEDKKGMDSAIETAVSAAVKKVKDDSKAMREAEKVVRPYVGDLAIACDSAEDVYKIALETLGVDTKGVHPSAYRAVLKAQPIPGSVKNSAPAMDSASVKGFNERFPDAGRIKSL